MVERIYIKLISKYPNNYLLSNFYKKIRNLMFKNIIYLIY